MEGIEVKFEQTMDTRKIFVIVGTNECPTCKIPLKHGREVLNLVKNREECWKKFDFDPNIGQVNLKCPKCRNGFLLYDNFMRAD